MEPRNPNIKVIGVWWAWCTIINKIISEWLDGVDFVWINDNENIDSCLATTKLDLWLKDIGSLGWQWDYTVWEAAAEKHIWDIKHMLANTDMVLLVYSMWGRIWAWAWPIVAEVARTMWILTIGIVSKPFAFQQKLIKKSVWERIMKVEKSVDALILIPNYDIYKNLKKLSFKQIFGMMDNRSLFVIKSISNLIVKPGDIHIDFADINYILKDSWIWNVWMAHGNWGGKVTIATKKAMAYIPLHDYLSTAKKIFFVVSGWDDLTIKEVQEAAHILDWVVISDVNFFWWMVPDDQLQDQSNVLIMVNN